jgi:hypothetical protein
MLPPRNVEFPCFRCSRSIGPDDVVCSGCGVGRDLARDIHGELSPAIKQLRALLAIVVVLASVMAFVFYDHAKSHGMDGLSMAVPYVITAVLYAGMSVLVSRFPMGVAMFGASAIVVHWVQDVVRYPGKAMFAILPTGVRIILIAGFVTVILAVRRAARMRKAAISEASGSASPSTSPAAPQPGRSH